MLVDTLVKLYEISGGDLPEPLRFCNYSEVGGNDVSFDQQFYTAYPIQSASGWERSLDGALPRPTIVLSNLFGEISGAVKQYKLIGARITRKTIAVKNLDSGDDPQYEILRQENYFLSRISWNSQTVTLHLRSPIDVENLKLPRRTVGSLLT